MILAPSVRYRHSYFINLVIWLERPRYGTDMILAALLQYRHSCFSALAKIQTLVLAPSIRYRHYDFSGYCYDSRLRRFLFGGGVIAATALLSLFKLLLASFIRNAFHCLNNSAAAAWLRGITFTTKHHRLTNCKMCQLSRPRSQITTTHTSVSPWTEGAGEIHSPQQMV